KIHIGDCREQLRKLADKSVHCVVTSPPYFALRDYGTAVWSGGDPACPHEPPADWLHHRVTKKANITGKEHQEKAASKRWFNPDGSCKCGARRVDSQIGLEPTPEEFVAELVKVFREVHRVLRDDGTLWLNLGDSYAGGGNYRGVNSEETLSEKQRSNGGARGVSQSLGARNTPGCKPKDLI